MPSQTFTTLDTFQKAVDTETTRIGVEFKALIDAVAANPTPAEIKTLVDRGNVLVTNLKAIGNGGPVVTDGNP